MLGVLLRWAISLSSAGSLYCVARDIPTAYLYSFTCSTSPPPLRQGSRDKGWTGLELMTYCRAGISTFTKTSYLKPCLQTCRRYVPQETLCSKTLWAETTRGWWPCPPHPEPGLSFIGISSWHSCCSQTPALKHLGSFRFIFERFWKRTQKKLALWQ